MDISDLLMDELKKLEVQLQQTSTRSSRSTLERILATDFIEIGRSGATYTKTTSIAALVAETGAPPFIAENFSGRRLSQDLVLLTYHSAVRLADGTLDRCAIRSSLWRRARSRWELIFHQATQISVDGFLAGQPLYGSCNTK